jgi:hypothetical protein
VSQPLTLLFYNQSGLSIPDSLPDCPWPYRLHFDRSQLPQADVVIFHIPTLWEPIDIPRRSGQLWVAWSMESDVNYPHLADPAFMQQFDLTMTYRRSSDIWVPYLGTRTLAKLQEPAIDKTAHAPAVYFASGAFDRSGRNRYVEELLHYLPIDSYGRCLHNKTLPHDNGRATKLETIARYKFTLAFENSISPDYVTEKFFDPLLVGSVPVYLGAENVDEFAPGDHAFIAVRDFAGPADLANYLSFLSDNDEEYAEYLSWKHKPLRESFVEMVDATRIHPFSRLITLAHRRKETGSCPA